MRIRLPISASLLLSHLLAIALVSGSVGTYFYFSARHSLTESLQTRLQNSAAMVSQLIDARDLDGIRGPGDVRLPEYQRTLAQLRKLRRSNQDIAFLYIMRRLGERVVFVVDSDDSDEQALPGKAYTEFVPSLLAGFGQPSVDDRIITDEWGQFMSGYAPLRNGKGEYLIGMDMRADAVQDKFHELRKSALASLAGAMLLALLFAQILARRFVGPIESLVDHCQAIAQGRLEGRLEPTQASNEFDRLVTAFNTMSANLETMRERNRRATDELRQAREGLEQRVAERTESLNHSNERLRHEMAEREQREFEKERLRRDLQSATASVQTLSGLLPLCAVCKKIRDDRGAWCRMEDYVERRSKAEFTHSLCPDCSKQKYPDGGRGTG